jgi:hypothetical protein
LSFSSQFQKSFVPFQDESLSLSWALMLRQKTQKEAFQHFLLNSQINSTQIVLLKEILDQIDLNEVQVGWMNESLEILAQSHEQMQSLKKEVQLRMNEFAEKWIHRLKSDSLYSLLQIGGWIEKTEGQSILKLKVQNHPKSIVDLFYTLFHIPVGDAEKVLVFVMSKLDLYYENSVQKWMENTISSEISKLMPALEQTLWPMEQEMLRKIRTSLYPLSQKLFQNGLRSHFGQSFQNEAHLTMEFGLEEWDLMREFETPAQGYVQKVKDLTEQICYKLIELREKRMELLLRGWSQGQSDIFLSSPKSEA